MKRKALFLITVLTATAACSETPETVGKVSEPLYVDAVGGGHGPFVAPANSSPSTVPPVGVADVWDANGNGQRFIGDFRTATHPGYASMPDVATQWIILSNRDLGQTSGYACKGAISGPTDDPCRGQPGSDISSFNNISFSVNHLPFVARTVVLGYTLNCPTTPGINSICYCSGAAAPIDGSGYRTVVMHDSFGHSLMNPDGPVASDCLVTSSQYPGLIPPGETDVAVYSCPGC